MEAEDGDPKLKIFWGNIPPDPPKLRCFLLHVGTVHPQNLSLRLWESEIHTHAGLIVRFEITVLVSCFKC